MENNWRVCSLCLFWPREGLSFNSKIILFCIHTTVQMWTWYFPFFGSFLPEISARLSACIDSSSLSCNPHLVPPCLPVKGETLSLQLWENLVLWCNKMGKKSKWVKFRFVSQNTEFKLIWLFFWKYISSIWWFRGGWSVGWVGGLTIRSWEGGIVWNILKWCEMKNWD